MVGKQNTEKVKVICEMEVTLKMIGGKYKPLIIEYLIKEGTKRFNELMRYLSGISQRTLTTQLRELEQDGLIKRTVYAEIPPKVEYSITDKGKTLVPILDLMCEWGAKNMDDRYELPIRNVNKAGLFAVSKTANACFLHYSNFLFLWKCCITQSYRLSRSVLY